MKRPEKEELLKYHAFYDKDTKFASHARLLQSKWREKNNHPMNDQPRSNYGNFLETKYAKTKKVNFLTQ